MRSCFFKQGLFATYCEIPAEYVSKYKVMQGNSLLIQDPFCVVKFIKSIIMQKGTLLYSICCKIRTETAEWWQESFHG